MNTKYVPIREAAKFYGRGVATIRQWADSGKLKSIRTKGNHRLIEINRDDDEENDQRDVKTNPPDKAGLNAKDVIIPAQWVSSIRDVNSAYVLMMLLDACKTAIPIVWQGQSTVIDGCIGYEGHKLYVVSLQFAIKYCIAHDHFLSALHILSNLGLITFHIHDSAISIEIIYPALAKLPQISIPAGQISTFLDEISIPVEKISTPAGQISTFLDEISIPVEKISTPAEEISTFVEEISTPAQEISTFLDEISISVEKISTSTEEISTSTQEISISIDRVQSTVPIKPVEVSASAQGISTNPVIGNTEALGEVVVEEEIPLLEAELVEPELPKRGRKSRKLSDNDDLTEYLDAWNRYAPKRWARHLKVPQRAGIYIRKFQEKYGDKSLEAWTIAIKRCQIDPFTNFVASWDMSQFTSNDKPSTYYEQHLIYGDVLPSSGSTQHEIDEWLNS